MVRFSIYVSRVDTLTYFSDTETFKCLVADGSFFNRMLRRVAKTELKSKKQSTKTETYLKFMMNRLQF